MFKSNTGMISVKDADRVTRTTHSIVVAAFGMAVSPLSDQERKGVRELFIQHVTALFQFERSKGSLTQYQEDLVNTQLGVLVQLLMDPDTEKLWEQEDQLRRR